MHVVVIGDNWFQVLTQTGERRYPLSQGPQQRLFEALVGLPGITLFRHFVHNKSDRQIIDTTLRTETERNSEAQNCSTRTETACARSVWVMSFRR